MAEEAPASFDEICERLEIPEALRKHISAKAPKKGKMAVARGLLPAPAKALLAMQYVLIGDPDEGVRELATKAVQEMDEARLLPLIDRKTHPKILEFVVYKRGGDRRLLEQIALLHQVSDKALCYLAEKGSERICEIVASNQERLIITPQLYHFLSRNPNCSRALLDRVKSFHRMYEIVLPELEDLEEEHAKKKAEEAEIDEAAQAEQSAAVARTEAAAETATPAGVAAPPPAEYDEEEGSAWAPTEPGELPPDFQTGETYIPAAPTEEYQAPSGLLNPLGALLADWGIPESPDFVAPPDLPSEATAPKVIDVKALTVDGATELKSVQSEEGAETDLSGGVSLAATEFAFDFKEDTTDFGAEFVNDDDADDEVKESIHNQIGKMTVGQKIKLAYKGNKTVRELLVRDSNKLVGVAVVNSGRITEQEVMTIAMNRSINEDVVRALTSNREYMRKYPVKVALVNNPKTPIPTAIGMVNSLHIKDLKKVSTNRNVSSAVFSYATKLYKAKKTSQG
ncbi:MAG: hypothetical protein GY898_19690 [Proteobacteria bacterium]|nr:hypothetical protein [Pseudomonadota bacterium]